MLMVMKLNGVAAPDSLFTKSVADTIQIERGGSYYYKGEALSMESLRTILKKDSIANGHLDNATVSKVFSIIFGGIGGFLVGYEAGANLS